MDGIRHGFILSSQASVDWIYIKHLLVLGGMMISIAQSYSHNFIWINQMTAWVC